MTDGGAGRTRGRPDARPGHRRRQVVLAAIAVLTVTAVANLGLFRVQEDAQDLADPHRALVRNDSDRLLALTLAHGRNVGARFTVYVWLGDQLPGSTVVVPPGYPFTDEGLLGLGRAEIELGDHQGELDPASADELLERAVIVDWFARQQRTARESSLERTGVPAVFASADFAVVVPDTGGGRRLLTYWSEDTVFLVDAVQANELGLPGAGS